VPIRSLAAALAGIVVLGCSRADANAQASTAPATQAEPATRTQEPQVTGAVGFPWGTPYDSLVARRGAPGMEQSEAEGVRAMMYEDRVLGREAAALFFVHPRHGMMRGGYVAPFNGPADCAIVLQGLDNIIARRYPTLAGEARGTEGTTAQICQAVLSGQGAYGKVWNDPANGARIMLVVMPNGSGAMLTYTTAQADAWERRKNDARF
jgi:hypothetical protein